MRLEMARSSLEFFDNMLMGCKGNTNFKVIPVQINKPIYGPQKIDFRDFFFPALILM